MHPLLMPVIDALDSIVLGKTHQIKLALTCLLAKGHLLIEDLPGMGKTTLAHALAQSLGLSYQRLQFTSDLLPADVLGINIFDRDKQDFTFHSGPIFTQLLLADEINRSTPKTQSALLEAMEERQVSIDGVTRALPEPFFVIATQNPLTQAGTFPLPESQLDRFLMRLHLGYPDQQAERVLLEGGDTREKLKSLTGLLDLTVLQNLQSQVVDIHASKALLDYVQRIAAHTRTSADFPLGLSPRGVMALLRAAKAWALLHNREHVLPDDVQAVLLAVVAHRVRSHSEYGDESGEALARKALESVAVVE